MYKIFVPTYLSNTGQSWEEKIKHSGNIMLGFKLDNCGFLIFFSQTLKVTIVCMEATVKN